MSKPVIYGDWGTSSCRLYLCEGQNIIDTQMADGIKFTDDPSRSFSTSIQPWTEKYGELSAVLCGMVGSNIGWIDTGYVDAPCSHADLSSKLKTVSVPRCSIKIVTGVRTEIGLSALPDVMRGEETQVFGWHAQHQKDGLLCLPGTHNKWVLLEKGQIKNFVTSLNGELFETLLKHSVLVNRENLPPACIGDEFRRGVKVGASQFPLTQLLMSVRAFQISGEYDVIQAKSYLLGLLIGSDVAASLHYAEGSTIHVIGGSAPASFYAEAIRYLGGSANIYGGQEASLQGLRALTT